MASARPGPSPIAALAVNLAVTPGGFAFLVGAGFSNAAGVPSAWEVMREITGRWHAAETGQDMGSCPDPVAWAEQMLGRPPTYSSVLECLCPVPEQRHEMLAGYFVGKAPTDAHRALARLVADGYVRIIVTTNFDRLVEQSLDELGIRWSRASSASDLLTTQPREVAQAFLLKLHGDYGSVAIRNTESELAELEPEIAGELRDIVRTHGLVAVGYAGTDRAVAEVLSTIRPRLGLYWAVRGAASDVQTELLQTVSGYSIAATDADDFMAQLERRVQALEASPSSITAVDLHRSCVSLIRRADLVGLRGLVKSQGAAVIDWWESWREAVADRQRSWNDPRNESPGQQDPRIQRFAEEFGTVLEATLAISLALVEFRREDLRTHLLWLDRVALSTRTDTRMSQSVEEACRDIASASILQAMAGAFALGAWPSLGTLLSWPDVGGRAPVAALSPEFHFYRFFDGSSQPVAHAHRVLLERSEVWQEATHDRTPPLRYVLWVGIVLAVQAEARGVDSERTAWTWLWSPATQGIETLLRQIGRHDELADVLASAAGDDSADTYRRQLPDRMRAATARAGGMLAMAPDPLGDRQVRRALGLS